MSEPRWPAIAAVLAAAAYIAAVQTGLFHPNGTATADEVFLPVSAIVALGLSYAAGLLLSRWPALAAIAVVAGALQWGDPNPFPAVLTIGCWLVGRVVRAHRQLSHALLARAGELAASRDDYALEALRYERARVARELHDIVAHYLSIIVIQAGAGRRLPREDPAAAELLTTISTLTGHARADLDALTRMFADADDVPATHTRSSIGELVARAARSGSPITCELPIDFDTLPPRLTDATYRIAREGLTNAIKHAPGAPVHMTVTSARVLTVAVTNDAPRTVAEPPAFPSSGYGIAGLRERVQALHGTLTSGPTSTGTWHLVAQLPR